MKALVKENSCNIPWWDLLNSVHRCFLEQCPYSIDLVRVSLGCSRHWSGICLQPIAKKREEMVGLKPKNLEFEQMKGPIIYNQIMHNFTIIRHLRTMISVKHGESILKCPSLFFCFVPHELGILRAHKLLPLSKECWIRKWWDYGHDNSVCKFSIQMLARYGRKLRFWAKFGVFLCLPWGLLENTAFPEEARGWWEHCVHVCHKSIASTRATLRTR